MLSMSSSQRSESLRPSLTEAKGSEAPGRDREVRVWKQRGAKLRADVQEPAERRQGRTSGQKAAKSISVKARQRRAGGRAAKVGWLISGDLCGDAARAASGGVATRAEPRAEVSTGRSSDEGRESRLERRPERCARVGASKQRAS